MFFSIIIPTCNRNAQLALCLDRLALGNQTLPPHRYEVIVTDDSPDAAAEAFCQQHYPWVRYYRGPKQGPAANRNHGARHANAPWLVFTDDDCLPDLRWLAAYQEAIAQCPECLAFEGAILPDNPLLLDKDMAECPVNDKGGCFWSANIMIAATLFEKIGGFDERFKIAAMEDKHLFRNVLELSNVGFVSTAIVVHPVRMVSLFIKLKNIPLRLRNWYLYERIYNNFFAILYNGFYFQLISALNNLRRWRLKSFVYNISVLLLLFPLGLKFKLFHNDKVSVGFK